MRGWEKHNQGTVGGRSQLVAPSRLLIHLLILVVDVPWAAVNDFEHWSSMSHWMVTVIYVLKSKGGEMDHHVINQFGAFHHTIGSESTALVICSNISLPWFISNAWPFHCPPNTRAKCGQCSTAGIRTPKTVSLLCFPKACSASLFHLSYVHFTVRHEDQERPNKIPFLELCEVSLCPFL